MHMFCVPFQFCSSHHSQFCSSRHPLKSPLTIEDPSYTYHFSCACGRDDNKVDDDDDDDDSDDHDEDDDDDHDGEIGIYICIYIYIYATGFVKLQPQTRTTVIKYVKTDPFELNKNAFEPPDQGLQFETNPILLERFQT